MYYTQQKHTRSNGTQLISSILCGKCEKMEPMEWLIYVQNEIELRAACHMDMDMDEQQTRTNHHIRYIIVFNVFLPCIIYNVIYKYMCNHHCLFAHWLFVLFLFWFWFPLLFAIVRIPFFQFCSVHKPLRGFHQMSENDIVRQNLKTSFFFSLSLVHFYE